MPELPEVETTRCGIAPHLVGHVIDRVIVRNHQLRWPVPANLADTLAGQLIERVVRRAKYLLIDCQKGTLIVHLGMSGSLRIVKTGADYLKHDHIELSLDNGICLRYCDPRRFGSWLWTTEPVAEHSLLRTLGPEPLGRCFSGKYLQSACFTRKQAIKTAIMDSKIVVGVGNIYANEALFIAGIHPGRPAGSLSESEYKVLTQAVKKVLSRAIKHGGTTLRDYVNGDGKPGYFAQELLVYGRAGEPCKKCGNALHASRQGQRTTVFCNHCQS